MAYATNSIGNQTQAAQSYIELGYADDLLSSTIERKGHSPEVQRLEVLCVFYKETLERQQAAESERELHIFNNQLEEQLKNLNSIIDQTQASIALPPKELAISAQTLVPSLAKRF